MGHYDSSYEEDNAREHKEYLKKLNKLESSIKEISVQAQRILPQRFIDSLEDMSNWIKANKE